MMNILNFYEAGRTRSGVALFPILTTLNMSFYVSTRAGNTSINKGDGSSPFDFSPSKLIDFTVATGSGVNFNYAAPFTGSFSVLFKQGLKDVYSIAFNYFHTDNTSSKYNIQDVEIFFRQFPKLHSIYIKEQANLAVPEQASRIKGDFAKLPDSCERVLMDFVEVYNPGIDLTLNFSSYSTTSKLKYFHISSPAVNWASTIKLLGDLSKLPTGCMFFKTTLAKGAVTYTAGKVWASAFDTLSIPLELTYSENDNLLADMDNSVTSFVGSGKVVQNSGYRTVASDAHVTSLVAKGGTINIPKLTTAPAKILDLGFQNNFTDATGLNTMVAGGTSNQPTFALSGRKAGEYCAVFNGSQSLKTNANLPINSDKITIAFWMKTTQTSGGVVTELSSDYGTNNGFRSAVSLLRVNRIYLADHNQGFNYGDTNQNINNGVWLHVVMIIDRNKVDQNKIYINGVLDWVQNVNSDNSGNFGNYPLFIGQLAGNSYGFNGSLTRLKIYNYPFTPSEVSTLYNSEL